MAGAIDKEIVELRKELDDSPANHLAARTGILDSITLSREFSQTFLRALCEGFTGGKNESAVTTTMNLATVCESLAAQRLICYGAGSIKATTQGIRKFTFPGYGIVNGAIGLTEPNTSFMGIKTTDIDETYTITLSSANGATQTEGSNTFGTYIGDYYLVRSRVSGEIIDVVDDVSPYSTPDNDTLFGNTIVWGATLASEQEANTWNYNWAKVNLSSISVQSSGAYNELKTLTLTDHLTVGSNNQHQVMGPAFGQKFYLKRHADYVNTFTIIGTTSVDSLVVTGISDTDLAKIKYGDVIAGTGIPDDNVTIAAVQTADNKMRLSNTGIATADGTVTLTVNSVPFSYAKNDIFCQIEVVGEGLVTNSDWKPAGDDAGDYSGANEGADDLLNANTSQFIGLLGFFDPNNGTANATNDLTKGGRSDWVSLGKEVNETTYPYIEVNPLFPSIGSTHKAFATEGTPPEIIGTQPTGLAESDIPSGRYIRFDMKRTSSTGAVPEFRYITDSAEKFYYAPQANGAIATMGSVTSITGISFPTATEPRATLPRTGLTSVVTLIRANEELAGSANSTTNSTIPQDDVVHADGSSGYGQNSPTVTSYFYRVSAGIIRKHSYVTSYTNSNSTYETVSNGLGATVDYEIVSNYVARKLTTNGTTANADVAFVEGVINELQGTTAGGAKFRDPVMEGVSTKHVTSASANDANFDTYVSATAGGSGPWETALSDIKGSLTAFYAAAEMDDRNTRLEGGTDDIGTSVNFDNFSSQNGHAKWITFSTACGTLVTTLNARIAEIDGRIGVPTYSFSTGATVRVSALTIEASGNGYTAGTLSGTGGGHDGESAEFAGSYTVNSEGGITGVTITAGGITYTSAPTIVISDAGDGDAVITAKIDGSSPANKNPTVYISAIPSSNTTGGLVPYGKSLYNNVNRLLGKDIDLLGKLIQDIQGLNDLVDLVKKARNKFEIFNGRDKEYGDV